MRKRRLFVLSAVVIFVLVVAMVAALKFGEKSPLIAAGTVTLAPELTDKAKDISTLYLIVRDATSQSPMPIGAARKRISTGAKGTFYEFVLTREFLQLMVPESALPPNLSIKARLDVDGEGGVDTPGDLVGEIKGIALGASGVQIVIDRAIP
jgi:hypothetical protein